MIFKLNEYEVEEAIIEYVLKQIGRNDVDSFNAYKEVYFNKDIKKDIPIGFKKNETFECEVFIEKLDK